MLAMNEAARSGWMSTLHPDTSKLTRDAECDTVVMGSGIAGLSTAYELSGQGQKVIVLDRGKIGRGMTARTSAHLSANNDDTFKTMIDRRGEKLAQDFYVSQAASITRIETIQSSESIECDFRRVDGFLFPGPQTEQSEIEQEYKASQVAGMPVHYAKGVPLKGYESTRSLRYPNQATFHPTKYLQGLARCIKERNGRLFADTAVMSVEKKTALLSSRRRAGRLSAPRMPSSPPTRRSTIASPCIRSRRPTAPMRWRCSCRAASFRTHSTGIRSSPITTCVCNRARTMTISSSAAPTTRASRRMMRRFVTRRSRSNG